MIGLHAMVNEHFGIGIVEYMAAGLVPVANSSGGPLMDIVVPVDGEITGKILFLISGFLASSQDEYVNSIHQILSMDTKKRIEIQKTARMHVTERFSNDSFQELFLENIRSLLQL